MNFIEVALFILFFAIVSVPIATRFRLPLEMFLVLGSCIISLLPGLPQFHANPLIIFNLFLPPILFYAAYFTSWRDFKINLRPISLLAFGLVIFTMINVAIIAKLLLPFSWAECFLLGAIVSPTDAAAATSIIKKLGAPHRLTAILEGESLINDSTALILFKFSLLAVIMGSFSFPTAASQFFIITAGGIALGMLMGFITIFLIQKIHSTSAETTFTFVTAFACYLFAEYIGVSGVIATVVCGIFFGIKLPQTVSSKTRLNAKASWKTLIFIINGLAFTLIGFELPTILKNLQGHNLSELILYGIIISAIVIMARIIWVFPTAYISRLIFPSIATREGPLSWPGLFILSWSGMRGVVSLAAALSLPYFISENAPFFNRDLIYFITYCVIAITLIIPTFTLPFLIRSLKVKEAGNKLKQEAMARIRALTSTLENIEEVIKKENIPQDILHDFKKQITRRLNIIETQASDMPYSTLSEEYRYLKKLTIAAIETERKILFQLRKSGEIHDEIFHQLSDELDIEEMRADTLRL